MSLSLSGTDMAKLVATAKYVLACDLGQIIFTHFYPAKIQVAANVHTAGIPYNKEPWGLMTK